MIRVLPLLLVMGACSQEGEPYQTFLGPYSCEELPIQVIPSQELLTSGRPLEAFLSAVDSWNGYTYQPILQVRLEGLQTPGKAILRIGTDVPAGLQGVGGYDGFEGYAHIQMQSEWRESSPGVYVREVVGDIDRAAVHELGHALGFAHEPIEASIMNPEASGEIQSHHIDILKGCDE